MFIKMKTFQNCFGTFCYVWNDWTICEVWNNLKCSRKLFPKFWLHLWNKRRICGTFSYVWNILKCFMNLFQKFILVRRQRLRGRLFIANCDSRRFHRRSRVVCGSAPNFPAAGSMRGLRAGAHELKLGFGPLCWVVRPIKNKIRIQLFCNFVLTHESFRTFENIENIINYFLARWVYWTLLILNIFLTHCVYWTFEHS